MMRTNKKIATRATQGFSLIEMMIALVVMAIGLLGMNLMFITAMATNNKNSHDTVATAGAASPGAGATLLTTGVNTGNIDQQAALVANYSMTYVACAPPGSNE